MSQSLGMSPGACGVRPILPHFRVYVVVWLRYICEHHDRFARLDLAGSRFEHQEAKMTFFDPNDPRSQDEPLPPQPTFGAESLAQQYPPQQPVAQPPLAYYPAKHSGLGTASFCIGLVSVLLMLSAFVMIILMVFQGGGQVDPRSPKVMSMGLGICSGGFIALVGLAFGIAGFFARDRKRGFAIAGLVINGGLLLGVVGLAIIGMISKR